MKFSKLLQIVTPDSAKLLLILLLLLANSAAALANPWMAGLLTRTLLQENGSTLPSFQMILLAWLALLAIKALLGFSSSFLVGSAGADMGARLRTRVYEHLQILPMNYYQDRKPGELLTLLSRDAESISGFVTHTLVQLLPLSLTFIGAFVIMFWLDMQIALLAVLLMPVYYLAMKVLGRRIRPVTSQWIRSWSGLVSLVQENLGLIPAIKAFTREDLETRRFEEKNADYLRLARTQVLIQSILSPAIAFLAGAGLLLLLWAGISQVESGQLEPAGLVSLLLYAMLLTQPLSGLANVYGQVMHARGAAERLQSLFSVQPEPFRPGGRPLDEVQGKIEFSHVDFTYPGRDPLFKDYNLNIEAGETVALTGPNGAGKSTLAHLRMRFIAPASGSVRIDGMDIREASLSSLRAHIGLVAQHTLLLNGTVRDNIAYGKPLATDEEIAAAARAARAESFIEELPEGYDTVVGDQGVKLSGGQRQRLSLARTLLKDPPILILDEATAMFDPEGEKSFIEECHGLLGRKTVILITHRPASLALADRVVELTVSAG